MPRAIPTIPRKSASQNLGSLYRYFPSKEALAAALVARHNREILQLMRNAMKEVPSSNLATAMRALVKAAVDAHLVDSALHRIFAERVPRMGQLAKIEALTREYVINKPDALADDRKRFIDEVTRLLLGYLMPDATPRAGPRRPAAGRVRSA